MRRITPPWKARVFPATSDELFKHTLRDKTPFLQVKKFDEHNNSAVYTNLTRQRLSDTVNLEGFASQKGVVFRNTQRYLATGLHASSGSLTSKTCSLPFKYATSFEEKVTREVKRSEHWNDTKEYKIYAANTLRFFKLFDEDLSTIFDPDLDLTNSNKK